MVDFVAKLSGWRQFGPIMAVCIGALSAQAATAATIVNEPGYSFARSDNFNNDGYEYTMEAASGFGAAFAGVSPGVASASTSYFCSDVPEPFYCGQGMPFATSKLRYSIDASVSDEFYLQTGLTSVDVPLLYNWSAYAGAFNGSGVADVYISFLNGPTVVAHREAGGIFEKSGTYSFLNGTIVTLEAIARGSATAVADPFGGVDPNWQYANLAHLIDINTNPVPELSISAGNAIAPVPLPAGMWFMASAGLAMFGLSRRRRKA